MSEVGIGIDSSVEVLEQIFALDDTMHLACVYCDECICGVHDTELCEDSDEPITCETCDLMDRLAEYGEFVPCKACGRDLGDWDDD